MFNELIQTKKDYAAMWGRLALGLVILPHGLQKVFGWYGGSGYSGTMDGFMSMGVPSLLAFLAIMVESLGAFALIIGLLGRLAAFGIAVNMTVAIFMVHRQNGFFMNWTGMQPGEGFEFHLLAIGLAIGVMITGSGAYSADLSMSKPRYLKALHEPIDLEQSA